jgi:hypothetical protein
VLREHCERVGRDSADIEKAAYYVFDTSRGTDRIVSELKELADLGVDTAIGSVANVSAIEPLELIGKAVIPAVARL